ncbi:membrane transport family protein [Desulfovibrio sp. A2]|nr:membrane transport family protein [Desulfovibrio sp. A2]
MLDILSALVPVFGIIVLGMCVERLGSLPKGTPAALNQFVFRVSLPALLFYAVARKTPQELAHGGFAAGTVAGMLLAFALGYALCSRGGRRNGPDIAVLAQAASFPNSAFLGLPIVAALLPGNDDAVLAGGIVSVLCLAVLLVTMARLEAIRSGGGMSWRVLRHVSSALGRNPILLATLAGVAVSLSGLGLARPVAAMASMLGATASPCALFGIGMVLAAQLTAEGAGCPPEGGASECDPQALSPLARQVVVNAVKLFGHPALTWLCLWAFGVRGHWLGMGVLFAAMPTAAVAYVVAESYGAGARDTSRAIVVSTMLSALTLFGTVVLLRHLEIL